MSDILERKRQKAWGAGYRWLYSVLYTCAHGALSNFNDNIFLIFLCITREEVFMEGPLEPNMGPSLADVLLCTFENTNAGLSSFPFRRLLS
jgi:hypothetical protein